MAEQLAVLATATCDVTGHFIIEASNRRPLFIEGEERKSPSSAYPCLICVVGWLRAQFWDADSAGDAIPINLCWFHRQGQSKRASTLASATSVSKRRHHKIKEQNDICLDIFCVITVLRNELKKLLSLQFFFSLFPFIHLNHFLLRNHKWLKNCLS